MAKDIDKEKDANPEVLDGADAIKEEELINEEAPQQPAEMEIESEKLSDESIDENNEEDEIEKLKAEVQEAKDKYLRLYSEFENFRRRTAKERLDLIKLLIWI